ncbi:unnamed protein product, partial [Staurois parvus]
MQQYSEAKHRPRLKSGSRQQREQTTEAHGAGWRWRQQQWKAIHRPRFKKRKPKKRMMKKKKRMMMKKEKKK